jgi:hypothetical protein
MTTRTIHRAYSQSNTAISDLLQALFTAELVVSSKQLLVISPWLSDFPVLDNRNGQFSYLEIVWGPHPIRLSSVLRALLNRGTEIKIKCLNRHNEDRFVETLSRMSELDGTSRLLRVLQDPEPKDAQTGLSHEKALVADNWALWGSMNLTYNGVQVNGELVDFTTESTAVAQKRALLSAQFDAES